MRLSVFFLLSAALLSCTRRPSLLSNGPDQPTETEQEQGLPPAGASCQTSSDCASGQACVGLSCHYRDTSIAGEIYARSARAQTLAGDFRGALESFENSITAYNAAHRPLPPELVCESASLILGMATDATERERGARRSFDCFRGTLPGSQLRGNVTQALARLRSEGLNIAAFDSAEPPERFFTSESSRPSIDVVELEYSWSPEDVPGLPRIAEQLQTADLRRAMAECFIQDWDERRGRDASASLRVEYASELHDRGDYDVYEGRLTFQKSGQGSDVFETCLSEALRAIEVPRASRATGWQVTLDVHARIQSNAQTAPQSRSAPAQANPAPSRETAPAR